jgi:SAM-dependent methyltransferase
VTETFGHDKPVTMWSHHAQVRTLWMCKARAFLSMAGLRDRLMLRHIPRGSKILDIGCGGGRPVLSDLGEVTGLEPIESLAAQARRIYPKVVGGFAQKMPFADNSFDVAVSTDILGHIPFEFKDGVMAEIFRVLRPGGKTLHLAEADSDSWLVRIAKREPEAYRKAWVEIPDHLAMETVEAQVSRFKKAGFVMDKVIPVQGILPECGVISSGLKYHTKLPLWMRVLRGMDDLLARNAVVKELVTVIMSPFAFVNWFARPEAGLALLFVAHKPGKQT